MSYAALIVHHVQRLAGSGRDRAVNSAVDFKGAKVEAFLAGRSILQFDYLAYALTTRIIHIIGGSAPA